MGGGRPSGTVAFLFTDLEGSTRLWEQEPEAMRSSLGAHDALVRSLVDQHDGYVFHTGGDGFGAAFARVNDAAAVAADLCKGLAELDTPIRLRARAGIHVGTAEERDGNYFGPTLNKAARIMAAGHGGQILLSAAARALVEVPCTPLGRHRLKDLSAPADLHQLGEERFPPLRTLDRRLHNLPVSAGPLIGRDSLVATVAERVATERLVTLTGVGGTGKTSLAVAVGAEVVDGAPDGVWFVDLVPHDTADHVMETIADVIGLRPPDPSFGAIAGLLTERDLVVVLDNCEHLVDDLAEIVDRLLDATAKPRVLATSREPLELAVENVIPVPPLAVESDDGPAAAVELFVTRAAEVGVTLHDDPDALEHAASICRHLDGVPLAIELAAGLLAHMTPTDVETRLDQRFELLTRRARGRARRHASLEGVLAETWDLLDSNERRMLSALATFPGTFALEDAEDAFADLVPSVAATLGSLVGKALVATVAAPRSGHGYRLLETVKLFATRASDAATVDEDHDRLLASLARRVSSTSLEDRLTHDPFAQWWLRRYDDIRRSEARALERGRFDDAATLCSSGGCAWYGNTSGQAVDGLRRVDRLLEHPACTDDHEAHLRLAGALASMGARRPGRMDTDARRAAELFEAAGEDVGLARALLLQSWTAIFVDRAAGLELLDRSEHLARAAGAPHVADDTAGYRPTFLALDGRVEEAIAEVEKLLDTGVDDDRVAFTTFGLGWSLALIDRPDVARRVRDVQLGSGFSGRGRRIGDAGGPDSWITLVSLALYGADDLALDDATEKLREARAQALHTGTDDGLPDLLLVPALAAFRLGDHDRCARLLGAVRACPKPTQNFSLTLLYRGLRSRVGLPEDRSGLDRTDEIFEEAAAWLSSTSSVR